MPVFVHVKGKRVTAEFSNLDAHGQVIVHFQVKTSPELFLGLLTFVKKGKAILELCKIIVPLELRYSFCSFFALSLDQRVAFLCKGFLLQ